MEKPKIYLETTMFNFHYAPDVPGYRVLKGQVRHVFDLIKTGQFEPYTSAYAPDELEAETNIERREQMKGLIANYGIRFLSQSDEAERLAALYIQEEAVPWLIPRMPSICHHSGQRLRFYSEPEFYPYRLLNDPGLSERRTLFGKFTQSG
jgi:hypothetical protein